MNLIRNSTALKWNLKQMSILDQTRLPKDEVWIDVQNPDHMIEIIQRLAVRGAPLIGISAVLFLAHWVDKQFAIDDLSENYDEIVQIGLRLRKARPTAVNLMNNVDELLKQFKKNKTKTQLIETALALHDEDVRLCKNMAEVGQKYIQTGDQIMTICNTGGLATVGSGTALGVIKLAHQLGKKIHVWVTETRPLMQGARLTAWECAQAGIPFTLITDNMAAWVMKTKKINSVFIGADRIAQNLDSANKIGSYSLAVLAKFHNIPFYVVAPFTTQDINCKTGADIHIEERKPDEVLFPLAYQKSPVFNPAFDTVPAHLISNHILGK